MKIVMTNTANHTKKVVSFDEVCKRFFGAKFNRAHRLFMNCRLLENKVFKDREYEFKREVG